MEGCHSHDPFPWPSLAIPSNFVTTFHDFARISSFSMTFQKSLFFHDFSRFFHDCGNPGYVLAHPLRSARWHGANCPCMEHCWGQWGDHEFSKAGLRWRYGGMQTDNMGGGPLGTWTWTLVLWNWKWLLLAAGSAPSPWYLQKAAKNSVFSLEHTTVSCTACGTLDYCDTGV